MGNTTKRNERILFISDFFCLLFDFSDYAHACCKDLAGKYIPNKPDKAKRTLTMVT